MRLRKKLEIPIITGFEKIIILIALRSILGMTFSDLMMTIIFLWVIIGVALRKCTLKTKYIQGYKCQ